MLVSVDNFSFQPYKEGGFLTIKSKIKDPNASAGLLMDPNDLRLKVYVKDKKTAHDYLKVLIFNEIIDVVVIGQRKQTSWEISNKMPLQFDFRFNVFSQMFTSVGL